MPFNSTTGGQIRVTGTQTSLAGLELEADASAVEINGKTIYTIASTRILVVTAGATLTINPYVEQLVILSEVSPSLFLESGPVVTGNLSIGTEYVINSVPASAAGTGLSFTGLGGPAVGFPGERFVSTVNTAAPLESTGTTLCLPGSGGTLNVGTTSINSVFPEPVTAIEFATHGAAWFALATSASAVSGSTIMTRPGSVFNWAGGSLIGAITGTLVGEINFTNNATLLVRDEGNAGNRGGDGSLTTGTNFLWRIFSQPTSMVLNMIGGSISMGNTSEGARYSVSRVNSGIGFWPQYTLAAFGVGATIFDANTVGNTADYTVYAGESIFIENSPQGSAVEIRGGENLASTAAHANNNGRVVGYDTIETNFTNLDGNNVSGRLFIRDRDNGGRKTNSANVILSDDRNDGVYSFGIDGSIQSVFTETGSLPVSLLHTRSSIAASVAADPTLEIGQPIVHTIVNVVGSNPAGESNVGVYLKDFRGNSGSIEGEQTFTGHFWSIETGYSAITIDVDNGSIGTNNLVQALLPDASRTETPANIATNWSDQLTFVTATNTTTVAASISLDELYDYMLYRKVEVETLREEPSADALYLTSSGGTISFVAANPLAFSSTSIVLSDGTTHDGINYGAALDYRNVAGVTNITATSLTSIPTTVAGKVINADGTLLTGTTFTSEWASGTLTLPAGSITFGAGADLTAVVTATTLSVPSAVSVTFTGGATPMSVFGLADNAALETAYPNITVAVERPDYTVTLSESLNGYLVVRDVTGFSVVYGSTPAEKLVLNGEAITITLDGSDYADNNEFKYWYQPRSTLENTGTDTNEVVYLPTIGTFNFSDGNQVIPLNPVAAVLEDAATAIQSGVIFATELSTVTTEDDQVTVTISGANVNTPGGAQSLAQAINIANNEELFDAMVARDRDEGWLSIGLNNGSVWAVQTGATYANAGLRFQSGNSQDVTLPNASGGGTSSVTAPAVQTFSNWSNQVVRTDRGVTEISSVPEGSLTSQQAQVSLGGVIEAANLATGEDVNNLKENQRDIIDFSAGVAIGAPAEVPGIANLTNPPQ